MKIKNDNYDVLLPFGALIYKSEFTKDELDFLKKLAENSRKGKDIGDKLAGNIKTQTNPVIKNAGTAERFSEILHPHVINYLTIIQKRQKVIHEYTKDPDIIDEKDIKNIKYDFGENGPWFNYMWENEFNPLHEHIGLVSGIAMIQVPTEIKNERYNSEIPTYESHGDLEFVDGQSTYKIIPEEGNIFLFPAALKHTVYPWHSHVERITSSWNIFNISVKDEQADWLQK